MLKKQQKMTKIKQKNMILMSEKISVALINKGFSWKYVKVEYPLKQGLKHVLKSSVKDFWDTVKVEYPLKQGLKHKMLMQKQKK